MTPKDIESTFDFKYPALYHRLFADGMLDMGEASSQWYKNEYPTQRLRPPLLLFAEDFELLRIDEVMSRTTDLHSPNNFQIVRPELKFVPFGATGAGDLLCFFFSAEQTENVPIVYLWHDSDHATLQADSLEDFIFIKLLEAAVDPYELKAEDERVFKQDLMSMARSHEPYLSPSRKEIVFACYSRDLKTYDIQLRGKLTQGRGLITEQEMEQYLVQETPAALAPDFIYTVHEVVAPVTEQNKRRVGTITLTASPPPQPGSALMSHLKALNWRAQSNPMPNSFVLQRKNSVVFGEPSMQTIDATFRSHLQALKLMNERILLLYTDNETGEQFPL